MTPARQRPARLGLLRRSLSLVAPGANGQRASVDPEQRTITFSFCSDTPVDMGFGTEILSHNPGAIRNGVRQNFLPLLYNHNRDDLLGCVEKVWSEAGRLYCLARFGRDDRGEWAMQQVADSVLSNVSMMYRVYRYQEDVDAETYTALDWEVYEVSLVTVPADASVGIGRAASEETLPVEFISSRASEPASAETPPKGSSMHVRHILQDQANDGTTGGAGGATFDVDKIRLEAAQSERARVEEIRAMCATHRIADTLRQQWIADGTPIDRARGLVLQEIGKSGERQKPLQSLSDDIGLTDKEKRSYSLIRAIASAIAGDWSGAGFEREVSQTIAKRNHSESGNSRFFFPNDLPYCPTDEHRRAYQAMQRPIDRTQQRTIYQVGTNAQGGYLVETSLLADSFIEVLRNQSVTSILGATYLSGLVGKVAIPRQITQTAPYWVAESGAVTQAEMTFDQVTLQPKTVGALSKVSRLMLLQSTPAIEMIARRDLVSVGALAVDLAALSGSGANNQPTGIVNQSGVNSVVGGTNGAALTFDHIIQLIYGTRTANAPQSAGGFAINSKCIGFLSTLKDSNGGYLWDPQGGLTAGAPDRLKARPYAESNQLRSTLTKGTANGICSEIIYGGDWRELLIGEWGVTEIAVNPYDSTGFANGDVVLRMFQTIDIAVRHGPSFSVMSDALTSGF